MPRHDARRMKQVAENAAPPDRPPTLTAAAVAAVVTGSALAAEWVALAGRQAGAFTDALAGTLRGDHGFEEGARSAVRAYTDGLRHLALLPRTYGLRFFAELEDRRMRGGAGPEVSAPSRSRRSRMSTRGGRKGVRRRRAVRRSTP